MNVRVVLWSITALVLVSAVVGCASLRGTPPAAPSNAAASQAASPAGLPALDPVPDFRLTDDQSKPVAKADLLGHPYIMNFVFTRCSTSCPMVMKELRQMRQHLAKLPSVRTVTVTVDPDHDQPPQLQAYKKMQGNADASWIFLTGEKKEIIRLMQGVRLLPPGENVKLGMESHSTRLVLVDAKGQVRGYFAYDNASDRERLVAALGQLSTSTAP